MIEDQIENENESFPDESNDMRIDADEEMSEVAFEDSDDESGPEATSLTPAELRKDVSNIVIGLKGMHLKYKVHFYQNHLRFRSSWLFACCLY